MLGLNGSFLVLSQSHQPRTTLQLHSLVHSPWNSDSPHLPTVIKSPFISHSALHLSYCCYPNTNYLCYLPVLTRVSSSRCDITALDSRPCLYSPASQLSLHCSSVCLYGLVHTNTFFLLRFGLPFTLRCHLCHGKLSFLKTLSKVDKLENAVFTCCLQCGLRKQRLLKMMTHV